MTVRAWLRFLVMISLAVSLRFSSERSLGSAGPPAMGTSSCSARACHGSLVPVGSDLVRRDEYTKWLATDQHAQAYLVLFEGRSQAMAKNLGLKAAHTAERCLACHQYPQAPARAVQNYSGAERFFGIGCEACHGDAKDWLEPHTRKLTVEEKTNKGMTAMDDPARLAEKCVGCHVGSKAVPGFPGARDVNHDLIAAGHPRLNFEFTAFLTNLPPHWNEDKRTRTAGSSAGTWAVGQAVTAKAALELLTHRANQAKTNPQQTPWPEFAEHDCFACHHDLQAKSWRQEPAFAKRPLGSLGWGSWYYAMPGILAGPLYADSPDLLKSLDELNRLLQTPYPNKDRVASEARNASAQMDSRLLKKLTGVRCDARSLALAYLRELENPKRAAAGNWDSASQLYLALTALEDGAHDAQVGAVRRELLKKLAFPPDKEDTEKYDSPRDYQPKRLREILQPLGP